MVQIRAHLPFTAPLPHDFGRDTGNEHIGRDIFRDDGTSGNNRLDADRYAGQDSCSGVRFLPVAFPDSEDRDGIVSRTG